MRNEKDNDRSFGQRDRNFRSNDSRPPFKRFDGPKEMHQATCSECHNPCEVPFKPAEGKPVFCKDCFRKKRGF